MDYWKSKITTIDFWVSLVQNILFNLAVKNVILIFKNDIVSINPANGIDNRWARAAYQRPSAACRVGDHVLPVSPSGLQSHCSKFLARMALIILGTRGDRYRENTEQNASLNVMITNEKLLCLLVSHCSDQGKHLYNTIQTLLLWSRAWNVGTTCNYSGL